MKYQMEVVTQVLIIEAENEEQAEEKYDAHFSMGDDCPCGSRVCDCVQDSDDIYHITTELKEEKYPNAGEVLKELRETLFPFWRVELEYGDWVSVSHRAFISDDQTIAFGTVNGYWAFNDTNADEVTGGMEGIYDPKEIVRSFWSQVSKFYPELLKGAN